MLSTKVGSFAANTSTGNQSVTGVGFLPKVIIFMVTNLTASGSLNDINRSFGFAISSSSRVAIGVVADDAHAPHTAHGRRQDNTKCITLIDPALTVIFAADLVSMDADGFTINITTTDASARIISYIALGGADLTNVAIKEWTTKTSTGAQAITGVGFQPDSIIPLTNMSSVAPPNSLTGPFFQLGFGKSSTERATIFHIDQGSSNSSRIQRTDKIIETENGGAIFFSADLTSLDADGFTLNWSTANGTARYAYALCLKGPQMKIGSFNQATSTGNQAVTGVGFQPDGLILASFNNVASTSIIQHARNSIGFGKSSSERASTWVGGIDQDPSATDTNLDTSSVIKMMTAVGGGTPTTQTVADLVSLDADGFTINNTTVDATSREILFMAFGSTNIESIKTLPLLGAGL